LQRYSARPYCDDLTTSYDEKSNFCVAASQKALENCAQEGTGMLTRDSHGIVVCNRKWGTCEDPFSAQPSAFCQISFPGTSLDGVYAYVEAESLRNGLQAYQNEHTGLKLYSVETASSNTTTVVVVDTWGATEATIDAILNDQNYGNHSAVLTVQDPSHIDVNALGYGTLVAEIGVSALSILTRGEGGAVQAVRLQDDDFQMHCQPRTKRSCESFNMKAYASWEQLGLVPTMACEGFTYERKWCDGNIPVYSTCLGCAGSDSDACQGPCYDTYADMANGSAACVGYSDLDGAKSLRAVCYAGSQYTEHFEDSSCDGSIVDRVEESAHCQAVALPEGAAGHVPNSKTQFCSERNSTEAP
jgi:hypothetical protein